MKTSPKWPFGGHYRGVGGSDVEAGRRDEMHFDHQGSRTLSFNSVVGTERVVTGAIASSPNDPGEELGMLDIRVPQAVLRELQLKGEEAQKRRLGKR